MQKKFHNHHFSIKLRGLAFSIFVLSVIVTSMAFAQAPEDQTLQQKLHITANSMTANQNTKNVIFQDQVVAEYGQTNIHSDKLQVFYSDQAGGSKLNSGSVDKIIATGHVVIKYEDKTARCEQAVYVTASDALFLTGEKVHLESENSSVSGSQITIYQKTGQILVDGNDTTRVEVLFVPEQKKPVSN